MVSATVDRYLNNILNQIICNAYTKLMGGGLSLNIYCIAV